VNPDPLPSAPDAIEEVQGAPHPHAAELFMNWLLSQEGQQTLIDTSNRISLRSDVKNDPSAWNPDKWKPAWSLPGASPADFNTYTTELKNAFGAT
jgi:iron(III) transport system substrate-binding protein